MNILRDLVLKVQIGEIMFSIGWLSWVEHRLNNWLLGSQADEIMPEWPWAIAPRHESLIKLVYLFAVKTWDGASRKQFLKFINLTVHAPLRFLEFHIFAAYSPFQFPNFLVFFLTFLSQILLWFYLNLW